MDFFGLPAPCSPPGTAAEQIIFHKLIHKPIPKLRDWLIVFAQVFDSIAHNLRALLQRRIEFFLQTLLSAGIDNERGFVGRSD